jgi:membrane-bound lytic murein transglycosylase D
MPPAQPAVTLPPTSEIISTTPAIPEMKTEPVKYTVKSGDSFWKIARMYGVSKEELAAYNKMSLQKPLKIGVNLMIPPGGALVSPAKLTATSSSASKKAATGKATAAHSATAGGTYTVVSNDSLSKIAAKHKIKTAALVAANNLDPKKPLQIGQKLVIPGAASSAAATAAKGTSAKAAADISEATAPAAEQVQATGMSDEEKLLNELEGKSPASSTVGANSGVSSAATYAEHEVSDGDTVEDVAAMYGLKAEDLRKANPGLPADGKLKAPMVLKIPESSR